MPNGATGDTGTTGYSRPDYNRRRSKRIHICRSFIVLKLLTGSLAVEIKVNSSVTLQLPAAKLILPCELSTPTVNITSCLVIWERVFPNPSMVMNGYPSGDLFPVASYRDRVRLGCDCTCALDNPNINDTGIYKVKLSCDEGVLSEDSAEVNVTILPKAALTPKTPIIVETPYIERSTCSTAPTGNEGITDDEGVPVTVAIFLGSVCFITLLVLLILYRFRRRLRCQCQSSERRGENEPFIPYGKRNAEEDSKRYQELCMVSENSVRTTLYDKVLDTLENTESVTVLGDPGDGKTTILHLVCLEYSTRGYLTIEIGRPEDIYQYEAEEKPLLFVCDDFPNSSFIKDKRQIRVNWKDNTLFIGGEKKVLFSCTKELWRQYGTVLHSTPLFRCTVDVQSDKLTHDDKTKMINQHLGNRVTEDTQKLIVEKSAFGFPQCCRFVSHRQTEIDFTDTSTLTDIFANPSEFFVAKLEAIESENKLQYGTLVLCLLNERKLSKAVTASTFKDAKFRKKFELVKELYLSDMSCSRDQCYDRVLDTAKELNGWLFTLRRHDYEFCNDIIFKAVHRVFGARYPGHIKAFCSYKCS